MINFIYESQAFKARSSPEPPAASSEYGVGGDAAGDNRRLCVAKAEDKKMPQLASGDTLGRFG